MDHSGGGLAASSWAAMLGHHAMGGNPDPSFRGSGHYEMPMDLHMPQSFSYYRYRDDIFCWGDRKPPMDDVNHQSSVVNTRILELRKEKSRDAARSRRGKENYEFYELAKMLPLPAAITSQLDKASIIRLTISYLKLRDFTGHGDPPWSRENNNNTSKILKSISSSSTRRTTASLAIELFEQHQGTHILQSLDGFALAVAADGRFLYISETVSIYLGLSQVEMAGSSIFDYVHQADHAEVAEQLGLSLSSKSNMGMASPTESEEGSTSGTMNPDVSSSMTLTASKYRGFERAFCVRMKSTLTKRGCHFKSSGYRDDNKNSAGGKHGKTASNSHYSVVLMLSRLRPQYTFAHNRKSQPPLLGMVALAIALPPPSVHEIRLECDMFVTRVNFDFRIAHCEPKVTELLDYTPEEITGESLYTLCHGEDVEKLRKAHLDLINKGQVLTHYYRVMNKNGGYTWLQTCATIICNAKNADEQNIICVNYVISAKENANLILDSCQMEIIKKEEKVLPPAENSTKSPENDPSNDGEHTSGNFINDPQNLIKMESFGSGDTRNTNMGSSVVGKNNSDQLNNSAKIEETVVPAVVPTVTTRGRKRKVKPEANDESMKKPNAQIVPPPSQLPVTLPQNQNLHNNESHIENQQTLADNNSENSVKNLENVMSKHLPANTDFSTDSLLKQQEKSNNNQWTGHNTHSYQEHQQQQQQQQQQSSPVMPATSLLRQLYANRESVIRATTLYSDTGALPTPPSDYDNQFGIHSQNQKCETYNNLNYGGSYSEYNNQMTPPSSVSPRDVSNLSKNSNANNYEYNAEGRTGGYQPNNDASLPSLPLKPQPYSIHPHPNPVDAYGNLEYFHHPGFHFYHKGTSSPWYPTPT